MNFDDVSNIVLDRKTYDKPLLTKAEAPISRNIMLEKGGQEKIIK